MESLNVNKHWISPTTGSVSCLSFELALSMMDNCFFTLLSLPLCGAMLFRYYKHFFAIMFSFSLSLFF